MLTVERPEKGQSLKQEKRMKNSLSLFFIRLIYTAPLALVYYLVYLILVVIVRYKFEL